MGYFRTVKVMIGQQHPLYGYADRLTALVNNLANAALFMERQALTAVSKPDAKWTDNERLVMEQITHTKTIRGSKWGLPAQGRSVLSYQCIEDLMKTYRNPDYFAEGLPRQTAQQTIKQTVGDMFHFYSACGEYAADPSRFTGKPQLPRYKHKGGHTTAHITNQDCTITVGADGKSYAGLPFIKGTPLCVGEIRYDARLKDVTVTPRNGRYEFSFKFETAEDVPALPDTPGRICAIDFGVENLMAVTNNCGLPCLLYKGGAGKAANQLYNKRASKIISEQTLATQKKFVPTEEYYVITNRRNDQVSDFIKKCSKHFVTWCVEKRIDTVVAGANVFWKQNVNIGHENNQEFVQLPHTQLRNTIRYLCEWSGIRYIEQEESYTSQASFLDRDPIPVYGKEDPETPHVFSGKRRPTHYRGMYKKDGFRGLYVAKDGTIINADLNGSANILRKAIPDAFQDKKMPDFSDVVVIRHPDLETKNRNRQKQVSNNAGLSRSKQKRLLRKGQCSQTRPATDE